METDAEMVAEPLNRKRRHGQTTDAPAVVGSTPLPTPSSSSSHPEANETTDSQHPTKRVRFQEMGDGFTGSKPFIRRSLRLAAMRRQSSRRAGRANGNASESPRPLSPSISQQMTTDTSDGQT
ncbi:hypothetical protein BGX21_001401 [Mortierella sp. AD011]|nr:hypothetical protein BGX21_001401 [Mortierella sp. AD011]